MMENDDEDKIYQVERILGKEYSHDEGRYMYLVKWAGFDSDDSTWEPAENLNMVKNFVDEFEKNLAK